MKKERPLYRSKAWHKEERSIVKRDEKNKQYSKEGSEAIFFIDVTPNEELANLCREVFKFQGTEVKVVEKVSGTVKNPFEKLGCCQQSWKVCETGGKVDCKVQDVAKEQMKMESFAKVLNTSERLQGKFLKGSMNISQLLTVMRLQRRSRSCKSM